MALHVIVGAGAIGTNTALLLAERGDRVRVVTRSGSGPTHPAIEKVAADATDAQALRRLAAGAAALYNCANPPYDKWPRFWPPLAAALLDAAEHTGAVLVTTGNLYGYGPVDRPMTESMPLAATTVKGQVRAKMWQDALAAHEAGRVRATEARASDFIGLNSRSMFNERMLPTLLTGGTVRAPIDFDQPHTVSYVKDVARTLVTLADDERAWGRPWHVPSTPATP